MSSTVNYTLELWTNATTTANEKEFYDFGRDFMFYCLMVIIPFGLLTNTLSLLVFMSRGLRTRADSWYLAALAISDNLSLVTLTIDYWIKDPRIGLDVIKTSHVLCVAVTYMSYASRLLSAWLVITFTVERYVGVVYPLRRAVLSTTSHARKVVAMEAITCLVLTSFTLFTIGVVNAPYGTDCDVLPEMAHIYLALNVSFVVIGSILLPVLIICPLNMFIVGKVHQRRRHFVPRNTRFKGVTNLSYKSPRDYNIATALLLVSSTFVILNVPYCICWFVLIFHHFELIGPFGLNATWQLHGAKYITSVPYYLNFSINFLLYSLGAKTFRTQLANIIPFHLCKRQK